GYALVGLSSIVAIYIARKYVRFSFRESVFGPGLAALVMASVLLIMRSYLSYSIYTVWILTGSGIVIYSLVIYFILGSSIVEDTKKSLKVFFSK
ncbi:MAG: hypothetical protein P8Y17_02995, partial [Patescibacteria group bacterium]